MTKTDPRIEALTKRLAGEKLPKVLETAEALEATGKSRARALADALEKHKCLPKPSVEEGYN